MTTDRRPPDEQLAFDFDAPAAEPPAPAPPSRTAPAGPIEYGQLGLAEVPAGRGGRGRAVIPSEVWARLLADPVTRARYEEKVHRGDGTGCAWWTGAISDTGHGKLRISRRLRSPVQVVTAHVFGYQLHHGVLTPRPGEDLVIAHTCDEGSCQQPAHWELVPRAANGADYLARRHRGTGPLADVRGAHGRATAIRAAILAALDTGTDVDQAVAAAQAAGLARTTGLF